MITSNRLMEYVTAEPFLPFRMKMASGAVYEIKHPEMILIGRNAVRVYTNLDGAENIAPRWHDVSMMLMETVEPMEASSAKPNH